MKKMRITVEGKAYDVLVEILDEGSSAAVQPQPSPLGSVLMTSAAVTAPPASTGTGAPKASAAPDVVASSLAGKVVAVQVTVGQEVQQGQELLTVEAMKMNTFVYAPKAGKVAEIFVNVGDAVEEGQGLVKLA